MYSSPKLIAKYVSILQKTENQYVSFLNVYGFKATNQELVDKLKQLSKRASAHQNKLMKIIHTLAGSVEEQSADGLKGIFKEGFYMIASETDSYTIDSIITFSIMQVSYYKLNYYQQLLAFLKQTSYKALCSLVEEIIVEEQNALLSIQEYQVSLFKDSYANPALERLVIN